MAAFCRSTFTVFAAKKVAEVGNVKTQPNRTFANIGAAVKAGAVQGCAPFADGIDLFGFYNNVEETEAQRYADVEITHGRVAMLASLGFLVGEQVEGSSFLFDSEITGPAINHFQQVPTPFWGLLGAAILFVEANRINYAWQYPFDPNRLSFFLLKDDFTPGNYGWDPLGLSKDKDEEWLNNAKLKELNNGRLAMLVIAGLVVQERVNGLNITDNIAASQ